MHVTQRGVFFQGCYGSNTVATSGRIHFIDDTMVDVYLNPSILAMLIGICAHDFKIECEEITTIIRRLQGFGDRDQNRERESKATTGWQAATDHEKLSFILSFLWNTNKSNLDLVKKACAEQLAHPRHKGTDNGSVSKRSRQTKRTVAPGKRSRNRSA